MPPQATASPVHAARSPVKHRSVFMTKQKIPKVSKANFSNAPNFKPDDIKVPTEVFEVSSWKALHFVAKAAFLYATGLYLINKLPFYLVPVGWAVTGIAMSWFFVVGADCGRSSFFKLPVLNEIFGVASLLLLIRPYADVKSKYSSDTSETRPTMNILSRIADSFSLSAYKPGLDKVRGCVSIVSVWIFAAIFFPAMVYKLGVLGLAKYWLAPFLDMHFRIGTFTSLQYLKPSTLLLCDTAAFSRVTADIWAKVPSYNCAKLHRAVTKQLKSLGSDVASTSIALYNFLQPHKWLLRAIMCGKRGDVIIFTPLMLRLVFGGPAMKAAVNAVTSFVWDNATPANCSIVLYFVLVAVYEYYVLRMEFYEKTGQLVTGMENIDPDTVSTMDKMIHVVKRTNWLHTVLLAATPSLALYGMMTWTFNWTTLVWAFVYYHITGFGITAGYHRLFAHKAYDASFLYRFAMAMMGAGAVEGSIRWWCRDHRAHHRYTDTPKDPYSAHEGFWYAHIGWMLKKQIPGRIGRADISDFNEDPLIRWQHRNYIAIALFMGFVFPMLVAGLAWGDYFGGFFISGVARLVVVHHSTFCVNSMAHYFGTQSFDDDLTPKDSIITALCTFGEGYHNFHHEYPQDFRNAIRWYQYDPTKWLIHASHFFGLVSNLKRFPENEIQKGKVQMAMKALEQQSSVLDWGPEPETLPAMNQQEVKEGVECGRALVIIDGIVHDVGSFIDEHPGGVAMIRYDLGKDVTKKFNGAVYKHSRGARNLLSQFRIARFVKEEKED
eukprot:GFYU01000557.1.p1 GENE.GFYU01000557.1~~GFYU01000557.1.p1  ORF type:complete len:776 (+),score=262.06 GFYU01000557.1:127-2454(+)